MPHSRRNSLLGRRPKPPPYWFQGCCGVPGLGTINDGLLAVAVDVGQVDARELVVWLSLVHLLFDAPTAFHRVGHILFELFVGRIVRGMEDLEEGAERLLDALLVPTFDRRAEPQAFV